MKRVAIRNMGCKLNTHEGEIIKQLIRDDFILVHWSEEAEYYVLNTCTVTAKTDARARQYIRNAKKRNPSAKIVVTGCYAQTQGSQIQAMPEVAAVVGNVNKEIEIPRVIARLECGEECHHPLVSNIWDSRTLNVPIIRSYPGLARPFVKIQDGCNEICSFCKIPMARGRNRSQPLDKVVEQARIFIEKGYEEIVFSGIHMGSYGEDLEPRTTLRELIDRMLALSPRIRLRLSSIEPNHTPAEFIDFVSREPRICRHFHLPLQSGSDAILTRMRRRYTASQYAEKVRSLHEKISDVCLGADVMVGFPGETPCQFQETVDLVQSLPIAYLHVFPYSRRDKTLAAKMPDHVSEEVKNERALVMRRISQEKWRQFRESQRGLTREAIAIEEVHQEIQGVSCWTRTITDNYIEVFVPDLGLTRSKLLKVRLTGLTEEEALGSLVP